jgi:hypothetical protein
LKSYNTVIAVRQSNGTVLVNNTKYSSTTSSQQNYLLKQLKSSHTQYEVNGGKERGSEGEDLSKESQPNYKRNDGVYVTPDKMVFDSQEKAENHVNNVRYENARYEKERELHKHPYVYKGKGKKEYHVPMNE